MRNRLSKLCIIIGGMLIAASLVLVFYNLWDNKRAEESAVSAAKQLEAIQEAARQQHALDSGENSSQDENDQSNDDDDDDPQGDIPLYERYPDMEMPTVMIDGYAYIGTIEFPDLNLKLPVMEEWDYDRLRIAPCRYSGSAYQDNLVIAGHNYAAHFSPIKNLPVGSEVIFTDAEGHTFSYEISWSEVLEPYQVEELKGDEDSDWDLTLFTCTTGGGSRHTIRCRRIR